MFYCDEKSKNIIGSEGELFSYASFRILSQAMYVAKNLFALQDKDWDYQEVESLISNTNPPKHYEIDIFNKSVEKWDIYGTRLFCAVVACHFQYCVDFLSSVQYQESYWRINRDMSKLNGITFEFDNIIQSYTSLVFSGSAENICFVNVLQRTWFLAYRYNKFNKVYSVKTVPSVFNM